MTGPLPQLGGESTHPGALINPRSEVKRHPGLGAGVADALLLFALYALTACAAIALASQPGKVANLWFSNAIAVAYLLTSPRRCWPVLLAAAGLANVLANRISGDGWLASASFLPANQLEILLAVGLLSWAGFREHAALPLRTLLFEENRPRRAPLVAAAHAGDLRSPRAMLALLACGALLPQIPAAAVGALTVTRTGMGEFWVVWQSWFEGSALGAVSVLALALYVRRRPMRVLRRELRDWRVLALALLAVGVTLISLAKVPFPFTYIALPLLLAAAVLEMGALLVVTLLVSVTIALSMALGVFAWPPVAAPWHDMFVYLAYGAALVPAQLLAAAMASMRDSHQRLAVATEELRRANEGLEQFVRIASHDLREPLNTVVQFSGLIAHDHSAALPPNAQDWLTLVIRAGSRMRHMLDDVLHYVRMQRGFPDPGEAVPLDALLQDVQQTLAGRVLETGASIQVSPLPVVQGHETLLSLLFQNLLSNALKFMPEGRVPVIEVSAAQGVRSEAGMAVITVADNGIGIAAKDLPKLFQPFSRLHLRKHYEGTGLGLALCRQIAEAHGGTVVIKSELGRGTRVVVRLPLAQG